jgi:hypothetical protein
MKLAVQLRIIFKFINELAVLFGQISKEVYLPGLYQVYHFGSVDTATPVRRTVYERRRISDTSSAALVSPEDIDGVNWQGSPIVPTLMGSPMVSELEYPTQSGNIVRVQQEQRQERLESLNRFAISAVQNASNMVSFNSLGISTTSTGLYGK